MEPTLCTGQVVWTDRAYYQRHPPQVGEVVVFRHGDATYIKRVYGLPGQTLYWLGDRSELVRPVRSSQADKMEHRWHGFWRPVRNQVPEDHVFVLGDNTLNSIDSRHFGAIPIADLIGRVRMSADAQRLVALEYSPPPLPSRNRIALDD